MNYIKHLTGFFAKINQEKSIRPTHISLYLALFQSWNINRFQNPTGICRIETMNASKINSKVTYHKCMRILQELGYIEYFPSYNIHLGTKINMIDFSCEIQPKSKNKTAESSFSEQDNGQANVLVNVLPYIYNKTNKNIPNKIDREHDSDFLNLDFPFQKKQKETVLQKLENEIPLIETVKEYFKFQENSVFEAERFFNYYSSNGWLIGGKTIMKDWKASARNWMLNTSKFTVKIPKSTTTSDQNRAQYLHATTDKNYAEPL